MWSLEGGPEQDWDGQAPDSGGEGQMPMHHVLDNKINELETHSYFIWLQNASIRRSSADE